MVQIIVRAIIQAFGGWFIGKGISKEAATEFLTGILTFVVTVIWSIWQRRLRDEKIKSQTETTVLLKKDIQDRIRAGNVATLTLLTFCLFVFTGCTTYRIQRWDPVTGKQLEDSRISAPIFTKQAAQNLKASTSEKYDPKTGLHTYSRRAGVDGLTNDTDVEGMNKLGLSFFDFIIKAAAKGAAMP